MEPIVNVTVNPIANIYFEGKCVSHSFTTAGGEKKSVGVIFPGEYTFSTAAAEIMELRQGACTVQLRDEAGATAYAGGQSFSVEANSSFKITVSEALHYICHFA